MKGYVQWTSLWCKEFNKIQTGHHKHSMPALYQLCYRASCFSTEGNIWIQQMNTELELFKSTKQSLNTVGNYTEFILFLAVNAYLK